METETKTKTALLSDITGMTARETSPGSGVTELNELDGRWLILAQHELTALVQYAYDAYGILAAPSYDVEAERAPDPLAMIHEHVNRAHEQQERNRSGARALGASAVHGVDL